MTSPFSFTSKTDGVDDHLAAHVNAMQNAADVLVKTSHGVLLNGRIAVSVSSNNLVVAIKTYDNGNPSASDPVYVRINNTIRILTTSLSFTLTAGLNYFNSGSVEFAAQEMDYFVYLIWNTAPATDAIDICVSRIPYGRVVSDFSATITNEKYLANSLGSPASTDDVALIGRFAATLSGTAAFLWSVPTFTSRNLIQEPIFETRWLDWVPTPTGFSANPTGIVARYKVDYANVTFFYRATGNGTSNATTFTLSLPFTAKTIANMVWGGWGIVVDNGITQTTGGTTRVTSAATVMDVYKDGAQAAFTSSGGKRLANMLPMIYEI